MKKTLAERMMDDPLGFRIGPKVDGSDVVSWIKAMAQSRHSITNSTLGTHLKLRLATALLGDEGNPEYKMTINSRALIAVSHIINDVTMAAYLTGYCHAKNDSSPPDYDIRMYERLMMEVDPKADYIGLDFAEIAEKIINVAEKKRWQCQ